MFNPKFLAYYTIRILNGCEVLIQSSVTRVTVQHHEACRVMPHSYPSDGIFNLHPITIMDSYSCIVFLRHLHIDLNICYFINFTLKITTFLLSRKVRYVFSLIRWRRKVWLKLTWTWRQNIKNDVQTSKSSYWRCARESSYTPHVRLHFRAPVGFTDIPVGYARNGFPLFSPVLTNLILHTLIRPVG